jgi:MFS family permease
MISLTSRPGRSHSPGASSGGAFAPARMLRMPHWLTGSGALPIPHGGRRSGSWHVLAQRRYALYFTGSFVSNLGTWLQNTAQLLLAYQLTHSAFAVGVVTCLQFSGFLVLGPWAPTLADRIGAKRVLVGSQIVSAGVAASMAFLQFTGALTEQLLMAGALGIGLAFTFALPLQTAMVPGLVRDADTRAALAMNSVSYNAGRTVGPVLCVAVFASIGAGWAFALNAISFVAVAVVIVAIYPGHSAEPARHPHDWAGLRVALSRPRILLLLAMVAAVTVCDDPVLVLGPTLARQVLAVPSVWPAYFLTALGLGTALGALVPTRPSTAHRAAIPLLALALSVIVFAAGITAWLSLFAALMAGAAALLTGAATQALLVQTAGPRHATQVMALWAIAWAGSKPVASLADGWLATHLGVFRAALLLALPALAIALLERFLRRPAKDWLKQRMRAFSESRGAVQPL